MKNSLIILKRKILASQFFWKLRHLLQPKYIAAYNKKECEDLLLFLDKYYDKSIIDFGCASGTFLYECKLKKNGLITYGIELNKLAISHAIKKFRKFNKSQFTFNNKLDDHDIKNFLRSRNLSCFDIAIFDRVLYCLDENMLDKVLSSISRFTNIIFIDDFVLKVNSLHQSDPGIYNSGYLHRDWEKILTTYGFRLIELRDTLIGEVQSCNAKSMIFKKNV